MTPAPVAAIRCLRIGCRRLFVGPDPAEVVARYLAHPCCLPSSDTEKENAS